MALQQFRTGPLAPLQFVAFAACLPPLRNGATGSVCFLGDRFDANRRTAAGRVPGASAKSAGTGKVRVSPCALDLYADGGGRAPASPILAALQRHADGRNSPGCGSKIPSRDERSIGRPTGDLEFELR